MTDIPKELVERMEKLIRDYVYLGFGTHRWRAEAQAIIEELPAPHDPDVDEAISIAAEAYGVDTDGVIKTSASYVAAIAAIKRGRELERSGK